MNETSSLKVLFIINPKSGNNGTDWQRQIQDYFKFSNHCIKIYKLPDACNPEQIKQEIDGYQPQRVIAVGGDGTVKLVAQCLLHTHIPMGILPAGSANGMAKELNIPLNVTKAMDVAVNGGTKKIHLIKINEEICIHLSDIGFNAFVIKKFEAEHKRGMWSYIKAALKVLWNNRRMHVKIQTDKTWAKRSAAMVVIANATKYGTGALINPHGRLDDEVFEVIVVKKLSVKEVFKMVVTHTPYDKSKTEVFQTSSLQIQSRRRAHFQVDGEYLGKINHIKATILAHALEVIIPD
jgi:YegS/Rv2252/BmrU family lipid kinase